MPSKSKAQRNLMAAAAHNPAFAKKVGVPVSVAQEFNKADKGKKFKGGGMMDKKDIKQDKSMAKKAVGMHEKQLHGGKKSNLSALKKGGMTKKMAMGGPAMQSKIEMMKSAGRKTPAMTEPAPRSRFPTKGTVSKPTQAPPPQVRPVSGPPSNMADPMAKLNRALSGTAMKKGGKVKCMAKGGSASKRADGCATKGKTKGRMI